MTIVVDLLLVIAALGSALVAGVFFAFSNFVMRALGRLADDHGIAAMQAINVTGLNPLFFVAFLGTGVVCLVVALVAIVSPATSGPILSVVGSALYLVGCVLVTGTRNVPLNDRLAAVEPDLLLLGNFGIIIRPAVLAVPRIGVVNVHWSLLPAHRGPNPSTSVLLAGETQTGVTFHVVDERIDAGPILDQQAFPIGPDDTATALYQRAAQEAERRVVDVLDNIERDGLVGVPQDLSTGSYHRRVDADAAVLDFTRPAAELDRKVRALSQPMARFVWRGRTVFVSAARPIVGVDQEPGTVVSVRPHVTIACGEGALALDTCWQLLPPAPWPAPWQRIRPGDRVG